MPVAFTTTRLIFRSWQPQDAAPFAALNADPAVMEFFPALLSAETSSQKMVAYQREIDEKGFGLWAVEHKSSQTFIGFIGLHEATFQAPFTPCVEIGWRLEQPWWNQGLATEGALACLRRGFEQHGLQEIFSFTATSNLRSERVMQKIGMTKSGEFEHPLIDPGHWLRPHVLYRIARNGQPAA